MQVDKQFEVARDRDHAVEVIGREETLVALFPEAKTEIVERKGDRVTARIHYAALGREGVATFHFDYLMDGNVRFEKVCDGNVWKQLRGEVSFDEAGSGCRVSIEMEGKTKGLVPEFTIRGPMNEQIDQMAEALQRRIED
ncbi:MAG: hypothetical protein HKP30_08790 [Myxococcales bacterium]|nr:hypothetical protein [Myxococcales bacterium]